MSSRPSLWRSASFLVLLIASIASLALGAWIVLSKIGTMTTTLTATTQSPTASLDVYGGQSWIVFGSALVGAGLIGIFAALALATLSSILPAAAAPVAEIAATEADAAAEPNAVDVPTAAAQPSTPAAQTAAAQTTAAADKAPAAAPAEPSTPAADDEREAVAAS